MKVELWEITKPIPYARNPRRNEEAVAKVASSIKEFGWRQPIVVDGEGIIIAGHTRLLAAQKLGLSQVPVHIATDLTPQQIKAYRLADNRVAEEAEWDNDLLKLELSELDEEGFSLDLTGFDESELADLLAEELEEGLTDEDAVPDVQDDPITVEGDVWLLGRHRLMCGDSTSIDAVERLMCGGKADMVFTDPPYGVNYDGGHATEKRREKLKNDDSVNMYDLPVKNAYIASTDDAPLYLWFADRYATDVLGGLQEAGYDVRCWIIWNKNVAQFGAIGAQYKSKHEPCIYAYKRGKTSSWKGPTNEVTVWDVARDHRNEHHPTQKPISLAERAMSNHISNVVLDLFGGSGSTLIACEKTARDCRMMELDPKYCDVIIRRWQDFTGKNAVHEETGKTFNEMASKP